jgi:hypothetical protein
MQPKELLEKYGRAQLGIDGNCGFALLGGDLQEGESEFIEIPITEPDNSTHHERYTRERTQQMELSEKLWACKEAFNRLKDRLNLPEMSYYFGKSHPYGR